MTSTTRSVDPGPGVGIVGLDCVLPGAPDPGSFWDLLERGDHGTTSVPPGRWTVDGVPRVPAGYLDDPSGFDHAFFGLTPVEASGMDVQQRMVLESAWRALEDAGIAPASLAGSRTGVWVGMMSSDWSSLTASSPSTTTAQLGMGSGYCMAANRVSYHLDLRGPSMTVDTACSSSLVALHSAARALRAGDCDLAVVAGVNLMLSPSLTAFYAASGLAAEDGRCRPFAASAGGIGRGEGVGTVVLRRLTPEVEASGLTYAELLGGDVGHDGRSNGLTAPSRTAQVDVIRRALADAGVTADAVDVVEAHGTGTILGDMIEAAALGEVFAHRERPVLLGSVKGNLGHLEGAAGIVAVIKIALSLSRRLLPGSPFADDENPDLDLRRRGLTLAMGSSRLPRGAIAGVSGFGMGGTNAHVVLRATGSRRGRAPAAPPGRRYVLPISADGPTALSYNTARMAEFLEGVDDVGFAGVVASAARLRAGRRDRVAVVADGADQARTKLRRRLRDLSPEAAPARRRPRIAYLFTGQGALEPGCAAPAAAQWPDFDRRLTEALDLLAEVGDDAPADLRGVVRRLLLGPVRPGDAELVGSDSSLAQPAQFVLQYALAGALADAGLRPTSVVGHSLGEFAAACVAGLLTPGDAARLVTVRGRAMRALPAAGSMLAVRADVETVRARFGARDDLVVAADNAPDRVVLAGADDAVAAAEADLADLEPRRLHVTHAFHSPLVAGAADVIAREHVGPARATGVEFYSTLTGRRIEVAPDAAYWARQITSPVRFREAVAALDARPHSHLVEIGPRGVLAALAADNGLSGERLVPVPGATSTGAEALETLARLWEAGAPVRLDRLHTEGGPVHRIPPYEFDHDRQAHPLYPAGAAEPESAPGRAADPTGERHPGGRAAVSPGPGGAGAEAAESAPAEGVPAVTSVDVRAVVLAVLREVSGMGEHDPIDGSAALRDDLGFDSLLAVRLGDRLRAELIPDREIAVDEFVRSLDTVDALVNYAHRLREDQS